MEENLLIYFAKGMNDALNFPDRTESYKPFGDYKYDTAYEAGIDAIKAQYAKQSHEFKLATKNY